MKEKPATILTCLLIFLFMGLFGNAAFAEDVSRMSKEELKSIMGDPELVIIDVRAGRDWNKSKLKIGGAVREDPKKTTSWADKYDKSKTHVLYCA